MSPPSADAVRRSLEAVGYFAPVDWFPVDVDIASLLASIRSSIGIRNIYKNVHLVDDALVQLVADAERKLLLQELLGQRLAIENSFLVWKDGCDGFWVPWHQDGVDERVRLNSSNALSLLVALSACTPENGTLEVLPGSHEQGYLPFHAEAGTNQSLNGAPLTIVSPPGSAGTLVALELGQACLFDVRLLHRSGGNQTSRARIALNVRLVGEHGVDFMSADHQALRWLA